MNILEGKNAVVFGASGSIGSAVAKEFAAEGALVFLAGRTRSKLETVAKQITTHGSGGSQTAVVDVLDDAAVNQYLDGVVKQAGKIDIVIDLTGPLANEYGNGKVAVELPIEEFMVPLATMVKSRFITAPRRRVPYDRTALGRDHFPDGQRRARPQLARHLVQ